MKFLEPRPFSDPEVAARKLVEFANAFEPVQDGRIYIERSTGRFCSSSRAHLRSTRPAFCARSRTAGSSSTRAGPSSDSPRRAPRCSPEGADARRLVNI
jgi:hypothetical protein